MGIDALIKTSELIGTALDWAVAKCEGKDADCELHGNNVWYGRVTSGFIQYRPSTDWAQAGPIIERERIYVKPNSRDTAWRSYVLIDGEGIAWAHFGPTPLVAAMRCYVASKSGKEVTVTEELMGKTCIELACETIDRNDRIVSDELMYAYERNLIEDTDEGGFPIERDEKLLAALETCMEYFLSPSDYKKFMNKHISIET